MKMNEFLYFNFICINIKGNQAHIGKMELPFLVCSKLKYLVDKHVLENNIIWAKILCMKSIT